MRTPSHRPRARAATLLAAVLAALAAAPPPVAAQNVVSAPEGAIMVIKGQTALVVQPVALHRLSIADPEVAEVFAVSPREVMVNGKSLGSTSLLLWDTNGSRRMFTVEVMPDTASLRQAIGRLFPDESVTLVTSGASVVLSGPVSSSTVEERLVQVAEAAGFTVINNLQAPTAPQVLLQVRFAEVSRTALRELGTQLRGVAFDGEFDGFTHGQASTDSEGLLQLSLLSPALEIDAVIRALQARGLFRSLAEPNLLARHNEEASFLAGGEFPFPVAQGGQFNTVTVTWKEFGVRLKFKPVVLPSGVIRLQIAPEVSSLDFSSGLRLSGFAIPSLLTRRAQTEVELRPGQHLAIAGLLDNTTKNNITKIPFLGDIPVLGELFRSRDARQARTELLVIVSPRLVQPSDAPIPLPTGEPETWQWDRSMLPVPPSPPR